MIKVIQTLSYLINGVLQKKREIQKGTNFAQQESKSSPIDVESHVGVLSQLSPKLEPLILLPTGTSS